jgi:hypothetical protein
VSAGALLLAVAVALQRWVLDTFCGSARVVVRVGAGLGGADLRLCCPSSSAMVTRARRGAAELLVVLLSWPAMEVGRGES